MISHEKKKKKTRKNRQRSLTPKLVKIKKIKKVEDVDDVMYDHITHGKEGGKYLQDFKEYFDLDFSPYLIYVEMGLYIGDQCLRRQKLHEKNKIGFSLDPIFNQKIQFLDGILISQLPLESRLIIEIYMQSSEGFYQCIGLGQLQLFDEFGFIKQGIQGINIWPFYSKEPRLSCIDQCWVNRYRSTHIQQGNCMATKQQYVKYFCILYLKLANFGAQMKYSVRNNNYMNKKYSQLIEEDINMSYFQVKVHQGKQNQSKMNFQYIEKKLSNPSTDQLIQLTGLLAKDPMSLSFLSNSEKEILFICRNHYKTQPKKLIHFMRSVDLSDPEHITEVQQMIKVWAPLRPEEALPLLDSWMADEAVRQFCVSILQQWRDDELALFLPQLTQSLQFETQHYTFLIEFLLERSLKQPFVIGHELFWYLKSQLFLKPSYEKFSLILEQFLMLCGSFIDLLVKEHTLQQKITGISQEMKFTNTQNANIEKLKSSLRETFNDNKFPYNKFCFAIDPRQMIKSFDIDNCKAMKSKKVPLLLICNNYQTNGDEIMYIFKTGDDLRQDILTLQLIRIMNKIWLDNGYDLKMSPYKVTATWDQTGIIELVPGQTLEHIQGQDLTDSHIYTKHIDEKCKIDKVIAFDNYTKSCAAYSVATFILGIGDRHPGNIMLQDNGKLFHIDFGHFLGNFKTKMGIKRERTAFVYTQQMHNVITHFDQIYSFGNQKNFERFQKLCGNAYNLIRKNSDLIINAFMMMISAGMPELQKPQDIKYTVEKLNINLTEQEAEYLFIDEIQKSKEDVMRRIDNAIHNIKHQGLSKGLKNFFKFRKKKKPDDAK